MEGTDEYSEKLYELEHEADKKCDQMLAKSCEDMEESRVPKKVVKFENQF